MKSARKYLKILSIIALAIIPFLAFRGDSAHADTAPYTSYDFNTTNLYSDQYLIYLFSGMTPGDTFTVYLERLNDDGTFNSVLQAQTVIADGSGNANITWFGVGNPRAWNADDQFPMRVEDSFSNVLGYHFLAAAPDSTWGTTVGDGDEPDKVCIEGCIHNAETVNSNHHNPSLAVPDKYKILTFSGDYAVLNYRCDFGSPDANAKVQIKDIVTGNTVFEAFISEFQAYNAPDVTFGMGFSCNNPIVLNVSGDTLNFINSTQDAAAGWSIDNPHTSSFAPGGYSYALVDDSDESTIREGMSVWGVTTDPNRENWTLDLRYSSIPASKTNRAVRRVVDENLYNAFPQMLLHDSKLGDLDPTNYDFFTFRQDLFIVSGIPGAATMTWILEADDLHYGQDTTEYELIAPANYTVESTSSGLNRQQRILEAQATYGFDTDAGSLVLFLILTLLVFAALAFGKVRIPQLYGLAFVVLAGCFIGFGLSTAFSAIIIGLAAITALFATVVVSRSQMK